MKKQLFVFITALGLGGVILIAGPWENFQPQAPTLTVDFSFLEEMENHDINPTDGTGVIDSCYINFVLNNEGDCKNDTSGITELSMGSRMFSFEIAGEDISAGLEVDSLEVVFEVSNSKPQIATFTAFGGTPGAGSILKSEPQGKDKVGGLKYMVDVRMKSVNRDGKGKYVVPGNLVVVIITIDPAEIPHIEPFAASYKLKGQHEWVEIYNRPDQVASF